MTARVEIKPSYQAFFNESTNLDPNRYAKEALRLAEIFRKKHTSVFRAMLAVDSMQQVYTAEAMEFPPDHQKALFCYWISRNLNVDQEKIAWALDEDIIKTSRYIAMYDRPVKPQERQERDDYLLIIRGPEKKDNLSLPLYRHFETMLKKGVAPNKEAAQFMNLPTHDFAIARAHFILRAQFKPKIADTIHDFQLLNIPLNKYFFPMLETVPFSQKARVLFEYGYTIGEVAEILHVTHATSKSIHSHLSYTGELPVSPSRPHSTPINMTPEQARELTNAILELKWQRVPHQEIVKRLGVSDWFYRQATARLHIDGELDFQEIDNKRLTIDEYSAIIDRITTLRKAYKKYTIQAIADDVGLSFWGTRQLIIELIAAGMLTKEKKEEEDVEGLDLSLRNVDADNFEAVQELLKRITEYYVKLLVRMDDPPAITLEATLEDIFKYRAYGAKPFLPILMQENIPLTILTIQHPKNKVKASKRYYLLKAHRERVRNILLENENIRWLRK